MNQSGKVIRVTEHIGEGYFVQVGRQRISFRCKAFGLGANYLRSLSQVMRKPDFCYMKTKVQNSCAVTAQKISPFVFSSQIGQCLFFINQ